MALRHAKLKCSQFSKTYWGRLSTSVAADNFGVVFGKIPAFCLECLWLSSSTFNTESWSGSSIILKPSFLSVINGIQHGRKARGTLTIVFIFICVHSPSQDPYPHNIMNSAAFISTSFPYLHIITFNNSIIFWVVNILWFVNDVPTWTMIYEIIPLILDILGCLQVFPIRREILW